MKPKGRLYIAKINGEAIGCIAIRQYDEYRCEMKRLFVEPSSRGLNIGRKLVEKVITEAKRIGYENMLLDTLSTMTGAVKLYESSGFKKIDAYYDTPLDNTIFMSLDLKEVD